MARYYALNLRALTWRERWKLHARLATFLVGTFAALAGVHIKTKPRVRPEGLERLSLDDLPRAAQRLLKDPTAQILSTGLHLVCCYRSLPENTLNQEETARAILFAGPDQRFWVALGWVRIEKHGRIRERVACHCVTRLPGGRTLLSTNNRSQFPAPPKRTVKQYIGASAAMVIDAHVRHLDSLDPRAILVTSEEDLEACMVAQSQDMFDYLIERRVLVAIEPPVLPEPSPR